MRSGVAQNGLALWGTSRGCAAPWRRTELARHQHAAPLTLAMPLAPPQQARQGHAQDLVAVAVAYLPAAPPQAPRLGCEQHPPAGVSHLLGSRQVKCMALDAAGGRGKEGQWLSKNDSKIRGLRSARVATQGMCGGGWAAGGRPSSA